MRNAIGIGLPLGVASFLRAALVLAGALVVTACGTSAASAPGAGSGSSGTPAVVVPAAAHGYASVVISAGPRRATLSPGQVSDVVPLRAAKAFIPPEPLSSYGLVPPAARIVFTGSDGAITVIVGAPTFDSHFVYVMRSGGGSGSVAGGAANTVYTVPADQLRAVLALVGVNVPAPAS